MLSRFTHSQPMNAKICGDTNLWSRHDHLRLALLELLKFEGRETGFINLVSRVLSLGGLLLFYLCV